VLESVLVWEPLWSVVVCVVVVWDPVFVYRNHAAGCAAARVRLGAAAWGAATPYPPCAAAYMAKAMERIITLKKRIRIIFLL